MGTTERLAPVAGRKATPLARTAFAVWGLMTEVVGATLIVGTLTVAALTIAATGLALAI
jgi:hypothetical protein